MKIGVTFFAVLFAVFMATGCGTGKDAAFMEDSRIDESEKMTEGATPTSPSADNRHDGRLLTTRGIRQQYIYFCTLTVTREDVRAFMAEHPEYTKANRFRDIVVKVYI